MISARSPFLFQGVVSTLLFDESMKYGDASLNMGDPTVALKWFRVAAAIKQDSVEAKQLIGVCLRMMKELDAADNAFMFALMLATTDLQRGKILRDWSMVATMRHNYKRALFYLNQSRRYLASHGDVPPKEQRYEYFMTLGFIGEVYRFMGKRKRAQAELKTAYLYLRGTLPYELNCLMRYMATVRWLSRVRLAKSAWRLASKTNNKKRKWQIVLLLFSVRLVDKLTR
jgi:tetratricopeptide (TPR) repeat protein